MHGLALPRPTNGVQVVLHGYSLSEGLWLALQGLEDSSRAGTHSAVARTWLHTNAFPTVLHKS